MKIAKLNNVVIKWEKLQRRDILQCRRCQRIGQTATNCGMTYRCVKCNSPHEPGQCKLPPGTKPEYGHPASYQGCPQIIHFKESIFLKKQAAENISQDKKKKLIHALQSSQQSKSTHKILYHQVMLSIQI